jgi:hypothetical protein
MPVPIATLKVRPNPWIEIDPRGLPCGVVAYEQPPGSFDARLVGATRTNVQKVQDAPKGVPLAQEVHTFEVRYSDEDVLVPNTSYYRRRIIRGELIAVDRATYIVAGGSAKGFEEQDKLLESIKAQAIRDFDAANGDGAFAALTQLREQAKQQAADVAKAAQADQEPKVLSDAELAKLARAQRDEAEPAKTTSSKKGDA